MNISGVTGIAVATHAQQAHRQEQSSQTNPAANSDQIQKRNRTNQHEPTGDSTAPVPHDGTGKADAKATPGINIYA